MYTALVLNKDSQQKLIAAYRDLIPAGWEVIAHHMTINMGSSDKGPAAGRLGEEQTLTVNSVAHDEKVMAVGVTSDVPSQNKIKHVTLAVNRAGGGKPFQSNQLIDWRPTSPLTLTGTIEECQ